MSVGKRIYLKRRMPDPELVKAFETIPASNVADVMGRNCAMNPRIHLVSSPKKQMMSGVAYTVKARGGDNLAPARGAESLPVRAMSLLSPMKRTPPVLSSAR